MASRGQQAIVQESQRFLQVCRKQLVQRASNFTELTDALPQTGQFCQGGVGAAAAVEQPEIKWRKDFLRQIRYKL